MQKQHKDGRYDEEGARRDAAQRPVQTPTDVGGHLLSFRSGKEHAKVQGPQVLALRNPALLFDQFAVHDSDLSSGPPKLMNPSFTQNQNASLKLTSLVLASSVLTGLVSMPTFYTD